MNTNNAANKTLEEQRRENSRRDRKGSRPEGLAVAVEPAEGGEEVSREVPARRRAHAAFLVRQLG